MKQTINLKSAWGAYCIQRNPHGILDEFICYDFVNFVIHGKRLSVLSPEYKIYENIKLHYTFKNPKEKGWKKVGFVENGTDSKTFQVKVGRKMFDEYAMLYTSLCDELPDLCEFSVWIKIETN